MFFTVFPKEHFTIFFLMKRSCFLWFSDSFSQHSDYWVQSGSNSKYIF